MTTQGIHNKPEAIVPTSQQAKSKTSVKEGNAADRKDTVEISAQTGRPLDKPVTYSRSSVKNEGLTGTEVGRSTDHVHDLEQIKQKINDKYYDQNSVIDGVADRLIDDII